MRARSFTTFYPKADLDRVSNLTMRSIALVCLLAACGGTPLVAHPPQSPPRVDPATAVELDAALSSFAAHESASDWTDSTCAHVASQFDAVWKEKKLPIASFNAGLAWQRCRNDKEARERFEQALSADSQFHQARAQLALYDFKKNRDADAGIRELTRAANDAKLHDPESLVDLAMLQIQRDGLTPGDNCKDDMECAKANLQRALAIDDSYMPAFNQLALYHLKAARKRVGFAGKGREIATNAAQKKHADVQQLELVALVCSQAIRKNSKYAPIHNTLGLIQNELGQTNAAVQSFKTAATLDPQFFEAQMNFASVNLSFRGFEAAEQALTRAVKMQPNDYDARLALALALRGQISDGNIQSQLGAVRSELTKAKQIDSNRPDAYYNEGILVQEYEVKTATSNAEIKMVLAKARTIFEQFIERAKGRSEYSAAIARSKERIQDIDTMIAFL